MNMDWLNGATQREKDQFKTVCNQLLSRTYVVRTLYKPEKGRITNPDYTFLSIHYEHVRDYLALLDWDLRKDDLNGYFYVINTDEANRCNLDKRETGILLAIRMIYEENLERLGLEREDVIACGDGLNDLSMIKYAGLGVAMGNAQQAVKDAADIVTLTNDEDGIVPVIEKYILG